jgi:hypothetical protein
VDRIANGRNESSQKAIAKRAARITPPFVDYRFDRGSLLIVRPSAFLFKANGGFSKPSPATPDGF